MVYPQPAAERPERVLADLLALLAIADQAIAMHERADAVLRGCAEGGPRPAVVRECGALAGEYRRLWSWSLDFAPHAGPRSLERRLSELVMWHCRLLREAARAAGGGEDRPVEALGRVAAELRSVRDDLDLWIAVRAPAG